MSRLDHAITALDLLGSVVQAVPVVGENLKSATEIAKKLCEMVKVCTLFSGYACGEQATQKMKDNHEGYEQLADRAARLLAAVANTLMKANSEKLKGMEGNVARLLMYVFIPWHHAHRSNASEQHPSGDQHVNRDTSEVPAYYH
jgi:hypothetical protein